MDALPLGAPINAKSGISLQGLQETVSKAVHPSEVDRLIDALILPPVSSADCNMGYLQQTPTDFSTIAHEFADNYEFADQVWPAQLAAPFENAVVASEIIGHQKAGKGSQ